MGALKRWLSEVARSFKPARLTREESEAALEAARNSRPEPPPRPPTPIMGSSGAPPESLMPHPRRRAASGLPPTNSRSPMPPCEPPGSAAEDTLVVIPLSVLTDLSRMAETLDRIAKALETPPSDPVDPRPRPVELAHTGPR